MVEAAGFELSRRETFNLVMAWNFWQTRRIFTNFRFFPFSTAIRWRPLESPPLLGQYRGNGVDRDRRAKVDEHIGKSNKKT